MAYYATDRRPLKTMTDSEQAVPLRITGEHARGFTDHVLFSMALGTGPRRARNPATLNSVAVTRIQLH